MFVHAAKQNYGQKITACFASQNYGQKITKRELFINVSEREMYLIVPRQDLLAIIVSEREMYLIVPWQDVLAIIVVRESCT